MTQTIHLTSDQLAAMQRDPNYQLFVKACVAALTKLLGAPETPADTDETESEPEQQEVTA
ncbi:MAG: hypothetical protein ACOX3S_10705 [Anaerolineae bacterium]|jgi:hypothetical protein